MGRARRTLSCFVATLSWSRALYLEFFFDQTMENFLRGHVHAFEDWSGQPRVILYDNLRSAVLERRGDEIHFNPRLMELCAHYHFVARPCQVRAGNQKGRVERAIRYVRESFWAGRSFTTLAECNRQARLWRDQVAHRRRWPGDDNRTKFAEVFAEEQPRLLTPPVHSFPTEIRSACARGEDDLCPLRSQRLLRSSPGRQQDASRRLPLPTRPRESLKATAEVARHHRTYDRHQLVLDPAHQEAVLKTKRNSIRWIVR